MIFTAVTLTNGATIQCRFQNGNWYVVGSQYSCDYATIISDGNLTHVIEVTGNHTSGKANADVKAFWIASSHLNLIPQGIEKFFPDLLAIVWVDGNLTTVTPGDLKPFPELQVFYVSRNKLVSLEGDLFKHTPNLRLIVLSSNLLQNVGFGLLDNLNNLTEAQFESNPCIDVSANTPAAIQELKLELEDQCPPSGTTTTSSISTSLAPTTLSTSIEPGECLIECVELIETLEGKIERQSEQIVRHQEENARQDEKIAEQADEITAMVVAIRELEKQIRELWARP